MKNQERQKGDAVAQQMADSKYKQHMAALQNEVVDTWHHLARSESAKRKHEETMNAHAKEMERLKHEKQQKGDETAIRIANQHYKKHCMEMMHAMIIVMR